MRFQVRDWNRPHPYPLPQERERDYSNRRNQIFRRVCLRNSRGESLGWNEDMLRAPSPPRLIIAHIISSVSGRDTVATLP